MAIDELPLVALLGCFAEGTTVVSGAGELRHKESDRIASVVDGLRRVGRRDRGDRGWLRRGRQRAALRGGSARFARRSPPRDARRGRGPGLARGVEVRHGRGGGQLSPLRGGPGLAGSEGLAPRWGVPGRARARGEAAGARPRWRAPRGARWDRTRPEGRPPTADLSAPSTSIAPDTTTSQARSCTWCSQSCFAGRKLDHDRASLGLRVEHLRLARLDCRVRGSSRFAWLLWCGPGQLYPQRHGDRHRRPGRGRQVDGGPGARRAPRADVPGFRRDVPVRRPVRDPSRDADFDDGERARSSSRGASTSRRPRAVSC